MDRDAIARARRRQQATEALDFERYRESALLEQIADVVAEEEGPRIDREAFAKMAEGDVALVNEALAGSGSDGDALEVDDGFFTDASGFPDGDEAADGNDAEEIARLEEELALCRRRQRAFERYLDALGATDDKPE